MPRKTRETSATGIYHVTLKGVNGIIIFEDEQDKQIFLRYMKELFCESDIAVLAWVLMSNHVHLILMDKSSKLSSAMARLAGRYALYFNSKHERIGHLFKGRFWSDPINDEAHLLQAVRYVHFNPQRAGINLAHLYCWSSFKEYVGIPDITDTSIVLHLIEGSSFYEYTAAGNGLCPFVKQRDGISDWDALNIVRNIPELRVKKKGSRATGAEKARRDIGIVNAINKGISPKQLQRITGLSISVIRKALEAKG